MSGVIYIGAGAAIVWLFFRGSLTNPIAAVKAAAARPATVAAPSLGGTR